MVNIRMIPGVQKSVLALTLGTALLLCSEAQANLLTNGDFEADFTSPGITYCSDTTACAHAISGWTTTGDALSTDGFGNTDVTAGNPGNLMAAQIGNPNSNSVGSVSQSVATIVNQQYIVTFYLAPDRDTLNGSNDDTLNVSFPNTVAGDLLDVNLNTAPQGFFDPTYTPGSYLSFSYAVTATATTTAITFTGDNPDGFWYIDDVSIDPVATAVPEPSPLALLLSALFGFGVFNLLCRARRRNGCEAPLA